MPIQAKMRCHSNIPFDGGRHIEFFAVTTDDPAHPDFPYAQAMPQAHVSFVVTGSAEAEYFEPGVTYLVTYEKED
jgi:glutamine amidotransferase-like uncharacterized protein